MAIQITLEKNLQTTARLEGHTAAVKTAYFDPREDMQPGELLASALGACMRGRRLRHATDGSPCFWGNPAPRSGNETDVCLSGKLHTSPKGFIHPNGANLPGA